MQAATLNHAHAHDLLCSSTLLPGSACNVDHVTSYAKLKCAALLSRRCARHGLTSWSPSSTRQWVVPLYCAQRCFAAPDVETDFSPANQRLLALVAAGQHMWTLKVCDLIQRDYGVEGNLSCMARSAEYF